MLPPSYSIPTTTRFTTYCLLSLASVAIFQARPPGTADITVQLLWITIPLLSTLVFHTINDHINDGRPKRVNPSPPPSYTVPLSVTLVLLGQIALWTRNHLSSPPPFAVSNGADAQVYSLHFTMSFWVLSECEFMREYWTSRLHDQPFNLITLHDSLAPANLDWSFTASRDCISYRVPCRFYLPPRDGWCSVEALLGFPLDLVYLVCFTWMGMVCLVYLVTCFANPDPKGDSFPIKGEFLGVFFTPRFSAFVGVDVALQRPLRLVNRMVFEMVGEGLERVWKGGHGRDGGRRARWEGG